MKPIVISHRGNGNQYPENTIEACEQAIIDGADALEVDIQQTFKGKPVVFHDFSLKRMAGSRRLLLYTSYPHLKKYHLHDKPHTIPSLKDFIEHFKGRIPINLDVKTIWPIAGYFARNIVNVITGWKAEEQIWISSFNPSLLSAVKYYNKALKTGLLFKKEYPCYLSFKHFEKNDFWHPAYSLMDDRLITDAIKYGKELYVWTVNDADAVKRLKEVDAVKGIISDKPSFVKSIIEN